MLLVILRIASSITSAIAVIIPSACSRLRPSLSSRWTKWCVSKWKSGRLGVEVKERVDIDLLDHRCEMVEFEDIREEEEDLKASERERAEVRVEIRFAVGSSVVICLLEARELRTEERVAIWKWREDVSGIMGRGEHEQCWAATVALVGRLTRFCIRSTATRSEPPRSERRPFMAMVTYREGYASWNKQPAKKLLITKVCSEILISDSIHGFCVGFSFLVSYWIWDHAEWRCHLVGD